MKHYISEQKILTKGKYKSVENWYGSVREIYDRKTKFMNIKEEGDL